MNSPLLKTILEQLRNTFTKTYKIYISNKFTNTDVCMVWCDNKDNIKFKTSYTKGTIPSSIKDPCKSIRNLVGQNVLIINGVPKDEFVPIILLLPLPSLFLHIGIEKALKFIKDWKGFSYVQDIKAVQYLVLPK